MTRSQTRKELDFQPATPSAAPAHHSPLSLAESLLHRPMRHLRGFARLLRRRTFVAALCVTSTAGLALATAHILHNSPVAPLAPPPAPHVSVAAVPVVRPQPKHRLSVSLAAVHALRGVASWYGSVWHGRPTASGETFDETLMTASHHTLPFGTLVRVIDDASSKSVVVRINDRGTLAPGRVIDLSASAADRLGILQSGVAHVHLEVLKLAHSATHLRIESN